MTGAAIRFESATVRYPQSDRDAVSAVSLAIAGGELVALLGPSGCGKSTLLRTVNRLVPLQSGAVYVDDRDVARDDAVQLRRRIGYAIQAVGLFSHMTVSENVGVVPSLLGWPRERIGARVDELLQLTGLEPSRYRDRRPRQLSGGEAQRVGVARALAAEPCVLLMDEPFGAVDAIVRASLQRELSRIVHEVGTTTLFVTHDVEEAFRIADRIVVMREGRVEQTGTPHDLLEHPVTPYVAQLTHAGDPVYRAFLLHAREAMREDTA